MRTSAVIVTYNRKTLLERCLLGIARQHVPVDRVFVIDNASTDGTSELLAGIASSSPALDPMLRSGLTGKLVHVRNEKNEGSAPAYSQGMELAYENGSEWIWVMDDDCLPREGCLEALLTAAEGRQDAIFGPFVVDSKTGSGVWHSPERERAATKTMPVFSVAFNGMLVHRRIVERIGLPFSALWIYSDDVEYCARAKRAGIPCFVALESILEHPTPNVVRKWKIGSKHLCVYIKLADDRRAYYHVRNVMFLLRRYWGLFGTPIALRMIREELCLVISRTIPLGLWLKAVHAGLTLPHEINYPHGTAHGAPR